MQVWHRRRARAAKAARFRARIEAGLCSCAPLPRCVPQPLTAPAARAGRLASKTAIPAVAQPQKGNPMDEHYVIDTHTDDDTDIAEIISIITEMPYRSPADLAHLIELRGGAQ